ncbi:ribosomal protein S7 [Tanacetum coccineum]
MTISQGSFYAGNQRTVTGIWTLCQGMQEANAVKELAYSHGQMMDVQNKVNKVFSTVECCSKRSTCGTSSTVTHWNRPGGKQNGTKSNLKKANASLTQELKECKTNLDESSRALGEATSSRDSSLIALQTKQTELEKSTRPCTLKEKSKASQSNKPCLYQIPYDTSDPANRFAPDGEEIVTLSEESRSKLDKDKVKPYNYTYQNSLYENFKPHSKPILISWKLLNAVRKTMERLTNCFTKQAHVMASKTFSSLLLTTTLLKKEVVNGLPNSDRQLSNGQETMSVENVASGPISQDQKASVYDNSDRAPKDKCCSYQKKKQDSSHPRVLEFLFSPLLEEYYHPNTYDQAEEKHNAQAPNASFQEAEFINLCVHGSNKETGLATDPEMCHAFALTNKKDEDQNVIATKHDFVAKGLCSGTRVLILKIHFAPVAAWKAVREEVYVAQPRLGSLFQMLQNKSYLLRGKLCMDFKASSIELWLPFNMRLWFPKASGFDNCIFWDADHAGCLDTRKSTSGGIQSPCKRLEYSVALSASCAQVMWMRTQLQDYGFNYNKIPLYCDSQSAIAISCKPRHNQEGILEQQDLSLFGETQLEVVVELSEVDMHLSNRGLSVAKAWHEIGNYLDRRRINVGDIHARRRPSIIIAEIELEETETALRITIAGSSISGNGLKRKMRMGCIVKLRIRNGSLIFGDGPKGRKKELKLVTAMLVTVGTLLFLGPSHHSIGHHSECWNLKRRRSRSLSPRHRRRRSRSPTSRRHRSRSLTPRRHKRQKSKSPSLSPKAKSPSIGSLENKIVDEKLKKEQEDEKKRRQQEAELKLVEEETAKRVEEAIRKKVEERLGSEEIKLEIERQLEEGRKKVAIDIIAQLEKEKEDAIIEARRKEEQAEREKEELERLVEQNKRRIEEAQRREAMEQQRREEERYRELEELQRQKEEALLRKKQQEEEERAKQQKLLGKNKSRPKLSFALGSK